MSQGIQDRIPIGKDKTRERKSIIRDIQTRANDVATVQTEA
jgi:hypothetical protein